MTKTPAFAPVVAQGIELRDIVGNDLDAASAMLRRITNNIHITARANVYYRILLGLQLIEIQAKRLWQASRAPSWDAWMTIHFPEITGLGREAGYQAVRIAGSDLVANRIGIDQMCEFRTLQNVVELVRLESRGEKVTDKMIAEAKDMPITKFRTEILAKEPYRSTVGISVDSHAAAKALTTIVSQLAKAEPEALEKMASLIEDVWPTAGHNPTDVVDFINAAVEHALADEDTAEEASHRQSDVVSWDDLLV